jgi:hypothetical protein
MSAKQEKKIRQIYRRDIKAEMRKRVDDLIIPQLKKVVKAPPRFFPKSLWYKLAGIFLNLK